MSHYCSLDLLPVELLHILLTYFLAHEILFTFSGVTDYIDVILHGYSAYRFDLKSIRKCDFDLFRRRILPEQILFLVLSDDNDTFVPTDLFFSHFRMEEFIRLRSLRLIDIDFDSLNFIFPNLHKLAELRSLSFDVKTILHRFPAWNNHYSNESNRLKSFLFNSYTRILPQLNRICLNSFADLILISLPHLRSLKLAKFSLNELEIIFQNSPQLNSLDICLAVNILHSTFILPSNQLIRLNLKLESKYKNQCFVLFSNTSFTISRSSHLQRSARATSVKFASFEAFRADRECLGRCC
jgi:hypothetical protein